MSIIGCAISKISSILGSVDGFYGNVRISAWKNTFSGAGTQKNDEQKIFLVGYFIYSSTKVFVFSFSFCNVVIVMYFYANKLCLNN